MDDEGEGQALEAQAEATLDAIRTAVVRLLLDGGVSPQLVALGVARVVGELGASIAVADGLALERVLGELTEFVLRAGREHHDLVRHERAPGDPVQVPRISPSVVARQGRSGY